MLIDHAPRIRAEQQQAADNAAIADLERRSAPLRLACFVAAAALSLGAAAEAVHDHLQRDAELAAQGEAFAQCLNGRTCRDNAIVKCDGQKRQPVGGLEGVR